jgi:hypothetical protein
MLNFAKSQSEYLSRNQKQTRRVVVLYSCETGSQDAGNESACKRLRGLTIRLMTQEC